MRKLLLAIAIVIAMASLSWGQTNVHITGCNIGAVCQLAIGQPWSTTTAGIHYIFTPSAANESMTIMVHNNNPTNGHVVTVQVFESPASQANAPTFTSNGDQWTQVSINASPVQTNASPCTSTTASLPGTNTALGTCSANISGLQADIFMAVGAAAAGSPDTYDLTIVQQPLSTASTFPTLVNLNNAIQGTIGDGASNSPFIAAASTPTNFLSGINYNYLFNPNTGQWDRQRGGLTTGIPALTVQITDADAEPNNNAGIFQGTGGNTALNVYPKSFNGSTWDRLRNSNAANETAAVNAFSLLSEKGPRWSVVSTPAAGTIGSASKAAGGALIRHVADCVNFNVAATAAIGNSTAIISIRDGASGAGTIIWSQYIMLPATAQSVTVPIGICGLNLPGSLNTAMTAEFNSGFANLDESVTLTGYDTQ